MARFFDEPELVIATHNPGKLHEITELLQPFGTQVLSASDLGLPEPEEDGLTFTANAEIKALAAVEGSGKPALSDDSGLVVPAIAGNPGIYSARWAGPKKISTWLCGASTTNLATRTRAHVSSPLWRCLGPTAT